MSTEPDNGKASKINENRLGLVNPQLLFSIRSNPLSLRLSSFLIMIDKVNRNCILARIHFIKHAFYAFSTLLFLLHSSACSSHLYYLFQPLMFENIVMETLHILREMATNGDSEKRKVN